MKMKLNFKYLSAKICSICVGLRAIKKNGTLMNTDYTDER